ncbi:hypothetical protein AO1008_00680 [Aspergillus oryzae 100-8]|uniref:Cyanovirin-N domain-containing protein n=1 Tax=Aspergillus oryzae (strain 3.042) TaxID=1160506 RepID=I8IA12_ASPO3|nr:hypothetical protein Ao3042_09950 [Aspergillus oryzae 3.042]KDE75031.1 hypothetical protein AO1008_00680 [Aspergillus oryzae 100-8]|eukprot:EIT74131.1 hypothetical protein Ao3042_09950 [Aspergillus oryzae 3.042]
MSNKPFNETARDLKLDEAAEENDDYILCGELQNDEGEWVAAEINLMKSLGCLNRLLQERPMLSSEEQVEACVGLSDGITLICGVSTGDVSRPVGSRTFNSF